MGFKKISLTISTILFLTVPTIIYAKPAQAGFWRDFFLGKMADDCIFGDTCKNAYNNYKTNYYDPIRKYEIEQSYIQQGKLSPLRNQYQNSGNPCVNDQTWLNLVSRGKV
jgi:hypothetical protein